MERKIRIIAVFLLLFLGGKIAEAQENREIGTQDTITQIVVQEEDKICAVAEKMPEFPDGEEARLKFLRDNTKYPRMEGYLEAIVIVGFIVEKDGRLTNFKIIRGVAPVLDEEALRVVKLMPNWIPATQRNKAVRFQYIMPVHFTLR